MGIRSIIRKHLFRKAALQSVSTQPIFAPSTQNIQGERLEINFPASDDPLVSIIIPFYNNEAYTLQCLRSIYKNLPQCRFEIILIDDNSSEPVDLSSVSHVRVIRNKINQGFLRNVNLGIHESRGKFIYLLNNDTIVHDNFLDALLEVFELYSDVGAVGSMLLNPDGSLQEAGSVFMKGNNISQIARIKPYYPDVNYIYQVDYCSGCSLLFKKYNDHGELNLMDESYAPAYFEETDLCFELRYKQGKKVYYTPFSKITHFDGASYNALNEPNLTPKTELFRRNKMIFEAKWGKEMGAIQADNVRNRVLELYDNKSITFFHDKMPEYDTNSGELRLMEIMVTFKELGYHVSLVTTSTLYDNRYNAFYQKQGICVYYVHEGRNDLKSFVRRVTKSDSLVWLHSVVTFSKYYPVVKNLVDEAMVIYDMVDIHHLRLARGLEYESGKKRRLIKQQKRFKNLELRAAELSDIIIPISDRERQYMEQYCPKKNMVVVSNIHYKKTSLENMPPFDNRRGLLFIGSRHYPNVDAVNFLIDHIMPLVWEMDSDIELNIVGELDRLIDEDKKRMKKVVFHGFVQDIADTFLNNKMMVVPLRYGAGVKGKIGQAYEYCLPIVSTSVGAEGMDVTDGLNILLADDPQSFANQIIRLNRDRNLWEHLQKNGDNVLKPYSKHTLKQRIAEIERLHGRFRTQENTQS